MAEVENKNKPLFKNWISKKILLYGEKDFKKALKSSYKKINKISFDGMNYRKDIGFDLD